MRIIILCSTLLCASALRLPSEPLEEVPTDQDPLDVLEQQLDSINQQNFQSSKRPSSSLELKKLHLPDMCKDMVRRGYLPKNGECAAARVGEGDMCQTAYEVPKYRFGDLFFGHGGTRLPNWTAAYFPNSIGGEYLKKKSGIKDYKALQEILDSSALAGVHRPAEDTVVIHFRGYDVFLKQRTDHENWQEIQKQYVKPISYYEDVVEKTMKLGFKKAVMVTGDHVLQQGKAFDRDWSKMPFTEADASDAIALTKTKLGAIRSAFEQKGFSVDERLNMNADCDLVFMAHAKAYVPSGGTFDKVLAKLVELNGGTVFRESDSS